MTPDHDQWRARIEQRLVELETALAGLRRDQSRSGPVIHVRTLGNLANRMIQYMAALSLQARLPGARICGISLPEWGIVEPELDIVEPALRIPDNRINYEAIRQLIGAGNVGDVVLLEYLQHVGNFLAPEIYRSVFARRPAPAHVVGPDEILISLRMKEVLTGLYPFYTVLPVKFYQDVVRKSGLKPVFFGQLTPSPYLDALREAFPDARFIAGAGPMEDFEVLRSAPNLCLSVSTFAWTAAYISQAKRIVIPVTGLFSRAACACYGTDHDLMPRNDPRYDFWIFPINVAVPSSEVLAHHAELDGHWRHLTATEASAAMDGTRQAPQRIEDYIPLFEDAFYRRANPEVARAVEDGRFGQSVHHYTLHGFAENRRCFDLDVGFYARRYLDAAEAVGFGRYRDLHHFHAARGAALGYLPTRVIEPRVAA